METSSTEQGWNYLLKKTHFLVGVSMNLYLLASALYLNWNLIPIKISGETVKIANNVENWNTRNVKSMVERLMTVIECQEVYKI